MKKKVLWGLVLAVPFVALLGWTAHTAHVRRTALEIVLPVRGYDPRDLLSGHYIEYQIDWDRVDCNVFPDGKCDTAAFGDSWRGQRFYIPESRAGELDRLFRGRNSDTMKFSVAYAYVGKGRPAIAKKMLINGVEWSEYLRK